MRAHDVIAGKHGIRTGRKPVRGMSSPTQVRRMQVQLGRRRRRQFTSFWNFQ